MYLYNSITMVDCVKDFLYIIACCEREGNISGIMGMDFVLSLLSSRFSYFACIFHFLASRQVLLLRPGYPVRVIPDDNIKKFNMDIRP